MPISYYNSYTGITKYTIHYADRTFIGEAKCAPEDQDMVNKFTGADIARLRAIIKVCKYKKIELLGESKALNRLWYSMNKSKKFNPKSFEALRIARHIRINKEELDAIKETMNTIETKLADYINDKEKFYQQVRARRAKTDK